MKKLFLAEGNLRARFGAMFTLPDLVVVPLILCTILLLSIAFRDAAVTFGEATPDLTVSLNPKNLPYYALRSMTRMLVALMFSLLFTLVYATAAAKSRRAEKILIPVLDFLQSLPILGFLAITTTIFMGIFRGSLLGLEAVAIFAIFTSQVWNMTFSFYHSLLTVPAELEDASAVIRQSRWHRFWTLEVPFAMPGLVWNTMMSVSGGWFFVVASEVFSVVGRKQDQALPGIGSYIALAIERADVFAMGYAALTLLALVIIYDQLMFRPLVAWSEKFTFELSAGEEVQRSWMLRLLRRSAFVSRLIALPGPLMDRVWRWTARTGHSGTAATIRQIPSRGRATVIQWAGRAALLAASIVMFGLLASFIFGPNFGFADGEPLAANVNANANLNPDLAAEFRAAGVFVGEDRTVYLSDLCVATDDGKRLTGKIDTLLRADWVEGTANLEKSCAQSLASAGKVAWSEFGDVILRGLVTMVRVIVLIALATLFWTPIGVWIGLRPRVAQIAQPLAQFAAAFPANLLFPVAVVLISRLDLMPDVYLSPLMILGTQWYILFNVIAGAIAIPNDLKEAASVTRLSGWLKWKTLLLPAIFPALVTGGITASGGSWNASIVAEYASWGPTTLVAYGLGSYIERWSTGEFNPHVALGVLMMGVMVLLFNRLLWRRLYEIAETRFRLA